MDEKRIILTESQLREISSPPPGAARLAIISMGACLLIGFIIGFVAKAVIG